MVSVTIQLTEQEIMALQERSGGKSPEAALKAWASYANPERTIAELRSALKQSIKEDAAGKGRRFGSGCEARRWLEG
jgi:hypothetical protein